MTSLRSCAAPLALAALLAACGERPPAVTPGTSEDLAAFRRRQLDDIRYTLRLTIPPTRTEPVRGTLHLAVTVRDPRWPLMLDFEGPAQGIENVQVGGRPAPYTVRAGHLILKAGSLAAGANEVDLSFTAGDASLNRNDDFLYALFVPDRARIVFPCFDQPDLKARFRLTLDVPTGWVAVSNAPAPASEPHGDRTTYQFAETDPISTYLFTFAAGAFEVDSAVRGGRTLHMYHRETDGEKVARNRDAIFDLHQRALNWLETYTGIPYPFQKFDFVLIPAFQFGGMEHPGATYYRADGLLLDESATQNQVLGRASTIAHETAHMWFGDLVTMRWFNDVWMKEVFANFMAAKIVNPSFPAINHELRFFLAHYPAAYAVDRTEGATPIRQRLDNLNQAGALYGPIIYDKAPIVMRQLELLIGSDTFRAGLREYLTAFRFGNATWNDLVMLLDRRTPEDLAAWSRAWIEEPGRPAIHAEVVDDQEGQVASLALVQTDPTNHGRVWNQRLSVALFGRDSTVVLPAHLSGRSGTVQAARGLRHPIALLPGARGIGYGRFDLDSATLVYLRRGMTRVVDPLTRGVAWVTLWDAMLEGRIAPDTLLGVMLEALPDEADELNVQRVLGYLTEAFWRFESARARSARADQVETLLWDRLEQASSPSLKAAFFRAYTATAISQSGVARLRRLWNGTERVTDLTLSENDLTQLAWGLAVRGVPDAEQILDTQRSRITNPDRLARFDFVRPALAADSATRDTFFQSLRRAEHRTHESWVLDAVRLLHHPWRAAQAERYILASLQLLEDIQRTGDIFFPSRWLSATLDGHNSASAAQIVRQFLQERTDYPPRLRAKILEAADGLFRASSIVR